MAIPGESQAVRAPGRNVPNVPETSDFVGTERWTVVPSPSCPRSFAPQEKSRPYEVTARQWALLHDKCLMSRSPSKLVVLPEAASTEMLLASRRPRMIAP